MDSFSQFTETVMMWPIVPTVSVTEYACQRCGKILVRASEPLFIRDFTKAVGRHMGECGR